MKKIIFAVLVLLFSANICFAVEVPQAREIYNALIAAGIAAALLAIIWGGVRYILSIGNPHLMGEARTWIISGFTGLLLVVSASFIYDKVTGRGEPSWEIEGELEKAEITPLTLSGVHLFTANNCPKMEGTEIYDYKYYRGIYNTSQISLPERIKSVKIENDLENGFKWKVITFNQSGYINIGGTPKEIEKEECENIIPDDAFSIAILNIDTTPEEAGTMVKFYEGAGHEGGSVAIEHPNFPNFRELDSLGKINYEGTNASPGRQGECDYLYKPPYGIWPWREYPRCLNSIYISDKYAVLLRDASGGLWTHQLFMGWENSPNSLNSGPWAGTVPKEVKIIPYALK